MTTTEKKAYLATALFVCAILPFVASIRFDALNLDDFQYAMQNEFVLKGFSWEGVRYAFTGTHDLGIWFPLTVLSYMGDVVCFGGTAQAFHIGNLLWHGLAAVALFLLLAEILESGVKPPHSRSVLLWGAFFGALFWVVHPLREESVAWIASRKDLVSGCFGFLGLACYVRAGTGSLRAYGGAVLCFALAIMGKPSVMSFPVIAVCLDCLLGRRVHVWRVLLLLGMAIGCGLLAIWMQTDEHQTLGSMMATSFTERSLNALDSIWHYVRATVWPVGLACFYPWPRAIAWGGAVAGAVGVGVVACLALRALWLRLPATAGTVLACLGVWFLAGITPMLSIIQFGKHAYADRFTYWPSAAVAAGVMLGVVWVVEAGVRHQQKRLARTLALPIEREPRNLVEWKGEPSLLFGVFGVASLVCICYGFWTFQTVHHWRNTESVLARACAVTKDNAFAHAMLGMAYAADPTRLDQAVKQLECSIAILPNSENMGSLALMLAIRAPDAQLERAFALAEQALKVSAQEGTALAARGVVALRRRNWPEAAQWLAASTRARGGDPMVWEWLGMARFNQREYEGAINAFEMALHLAPGDAGLRERVRQAEDSIRRKQTKE